MRNMIFISHASPEDDEFTRWLALQLAKEGYPVWCDLTKLLGGEDFWKDIEQAIRERTCKFLYVLSMSSNKKPGPLQELQVAQNVARDLELKDFVIPLLIDDLPPREINIQLSRIIAIPYNMGWAKGLELLLDKLEKEKIQKSPRFNPEAVTSWWRNQFSAEQGIIDEPDEYLSNWFPIQQLPVDIFFHELKRSRIGKIEVSDDLPFAAIQHGLNLVSFGNAGSFEGRLGQYMSIGDSTSVSTDTFLGEGSAPYRIDKKQARDFISYLLKVSWDRFIQQRALSMYEMANGATCYFSKKDMVHNDNLFFAGVDDNKTHRAIVGYKTIRESKRYWHFAIQSKSLVYPAIAYIIKPHVLFSDDGKKIWESKERLHKARRSQCKHWWNPDWRDRILAVMKYLAGEESTISIPVGSELTISIPTHPIVFKIPVSYKEPEEESIIEDEEDYEEYDDVFDDEEKGDDI